jgi:hypothetical protein
MTRVLKTTPRSDLRAGSGVNTNFSTDPSIYTKDGVPNQDVIDTLIASGLGYIRERWYPRLAGQHAAFDQLTAGGVGLFLYIGKIWTYTPEMAAADVAALAESPYADSVVAVCGPNEANAPQDNQWPKTAVAIQEAIYETVYSYSDFASHVAIVSCALMHNNVKDLDADYRALRKAGIRRWCHYGDFHYYPGNAGPIHNAAEAKRAREAFGKLPLWQSETGWTADDTDPVTAGRFTVEALLRNHLSGIVGTLIFEFVDESDYVPGREGHFGMRYPTKPKPAYPEVQTLLASPDGKEDFPGYLADYTKGVRSDAKAVVTSEGGQVWTVYLMKEEQDSATVVVRTSTRKRRYEVALTDSMVAIQVTALRGDDVRFTQIHPALG